MVGDVDFVKSMSIKKRCGLVTFLIAMTKYLLKSSFREEKLILAHSLRRCRPSYQERHGSRQRRLDDPIVSEFRMESTNRK